MEPVFFDSPSAFRAWLRQHGATATELIVGFRKRATGLPSMTWPESVDEALCVGWIDGVRRRIDDTAYQIRFTPRKATSTWSAINIGRVLALQAEGRMTPAGLAAFERRREERSEIYAYEQAAQARLDAAEEAEFRRHRKAWRFLQAQAASYRHKAIWRVVSAKRAPTRRARLLALIAASEVGVRL